MTSPKSQTEYTAITTIVVLAALQQQAEDAAVVADPEAGAGAFVPGTPLRVAGDQSNAVVAYWGRWNMKPGQRSAFAQALGGPLNIYAPGETPHKNRDRWLFDNSTGSWAPEEVLAALGFDVLAYTGP